MRNMLEKQPSVARSLINDAALVAGVGLLTYGAWLVYHPAGFIVLGLTLLTAGLNGARR